MRASIVIKAKNEADKLTKLFNILRNQTEKDFEIIVVDNASSDETKNVCEKFNVIFLSIPRNAFSYPKAANLGAAQAIGKYIVFLSAHSFPPTKTWLADGLRHFSDKTIAGAYGPTFFYPDSPLVEKITWTPNWLRWKFRFFIKPKRITKAERMGILGMTNAIIRKDLWEEHHFNEKYEAGGEDGEWAQYFFSKGYEIIWDPKIAVRHAHYIHSWKKMKQQFEEWRKMGKPRLFGETNFEFRGDKEIFKK